MPPQRRIRNLVVQTRIAGEGLPERSADGDVGCVGHAIVRRPIRRALLRRIERMPAAAQIDFMLPAKSMGRRPRPTQCRRGRLMYPRVCSSPGKGLWPNEPCPGKHHAARNVSEPSGISRTDNPNVTCPFTKSQIDCTQVHLGEVANNPNASGPVDRFRNAPRQQIQERLAGSCQPPSPAFRNAGSGRPNPPATVGADSTDPRELRRVQRFPYPSVLSRGNEGSVDKVSGSTTWLELGCAWSIKIMDVFAGNVNKLVTKPDSRCKLAVVSRIRAPPRHFTRCGVRQSRALADRRPLAQYRCAHRTRATHFHASSDGGRDHNPRRKHDAVSATTQRCQDNQP